MTDPVTAGAERAPAPVDLTGIDPIHWAEARRRVAILREWCSAKRHSRAQAEDAAERMGVSVKHFERLVVTWKRFGEARRVSGSAARRGDPRGTFAMSAATRSIIDQAIEDLGPGAPFTRLLTEVKRRCRAANEPDPSYGMVHYVQMRSRVAPPGPPTSAAKEIRVARIACLLPVARADGTVVPAPDLVLAVTAPDGSIVANRTVLDGDLALATADVVDEVAGVGQSILIAANLVDALAARGVADMQAGVGHSTASELLTTLLGSHIDSIPIRHRRGARIRTWPAEPLEETDAAAAIDQAVAAHNAARRASAGQHAQEIEQSPGRTVRPRTTTP